MFDEFDEETDYTLDHDEPIGILMLDDGQEIIIDQAKFIIGNNPTGTDYKFLYDTNVSGLHAVITREKHNFYILDNNSTNGTFLNGQRLSEKTQIVGGDTLTIADITMTFGIR